MSMSTRMADGLTLSSSAHLWKVDRNDWLIPSMSEAGRMYRVSNGRCTCRDFETRGLTCKHLWALRFHLEAVLALAKDGDNAESVFRREIEDGTFWERFRD